MRRMHVERKHKRRMKSGFGGRRKWRPRTGRGELENLEIGRWREAAEIGKN